MLGHQTMFGIISTSTCSYFVGNFSVHAPITCTTVYILYELPPRTSVQFVAIVRHVSWLFGSRKVRWIVKSHDDKKLAFSAKSNNNNNKYQDMNYL